MSFSAKQIDELARNLKRRHIRTRQFNGRSLPYIEGWHAIAEANRIFGHDGWDRETIETKCVLNREVRGVFQAIYIAKVRVTVRSTCLVIREGHGTGEAKGASPGEVHDMALKSAETDATKRALATFGKPFGLALYLTSPDKFRSTNGQRPTAAPMRAGANDNSPAAQLPKHAAAGPSAPTLTGLIQTGMGLIPASEVMRRERPPAHPIRRRDREHLKFVASQPCLICGRAPSDPHHLRFMQPRATGLKVSDEFTVPLCRAHHRQLHQAELETRWWDNLKIDAPTVAKSLWEESRGKNETTALATANTDIAR